VAWAPSKVGLGVEHYPQGATWAEPDLEHAALMLRLVLEDRDGAARRAARGHRNVSARLAPEVVGRQMIAHIAPLTNARGARDPRSLFKRFAASRRVAG
jgi:hypothetical protein